MAYQQRQGWQASDCVESCHGTMLCSCPGWVCGSEVAGISEYSFWYNLCMPSSVSTNRGRPGGQTRGRGGGRSGRGSMRRGGRVRRQLGGGRNRKSPGGSQSPYSRANLSRPRKRRQPSPAGRRPAIRGHGGGEYITTKKPKPWNR